MRSGIIRLDILFVVDVFLILMAGSLGMLRDAAGDRGQIG